MTETLKGISGSMFAGKTETLIKEAVRAEIAGKNVLIFKPATDDRWGIKEKIKSHSGAEHDAFVLKNATDIVNFLKPNTDIVAFDEIQFFGPEIVDVVQALLEADIHVIFAGLSLDFKGEPFGSMPQLLALCDEIEKPTAICTEVINGEICGANATKTQRIVNGQPANFHDPLILIGAEQDYQARCSKHHKVPGKPSTEIKFQSK